MKMKMHNDSPDPVTAALKIWVTGLVLGPVFLFFGTVLLPLDSIDSDLDVSIFVMWGYMVLYGGIFSLPSMWLLVLALTLQLRLRQSRSCFWATILGTTLFLTAVPFLLLDFLIGGPGFAGFIAAYLAGIWLGVYRAYGRQKFEKQAPDDEPLDASL